MAGRRSQLNLGPAAAFEQCADFVLPGSLIQNPMGPIGKTASSSEAGTAVGARAAGRQCRACGRSGGLGAGKAESSGLIAGMPAFRYVRFGVGGRIICSLAQRLGEAGAMTVNATFHDLDGKSVLITGGGSGIGAALTEAFLRQGANVAFLQRSDASDFCDRMEAACGRRPLFLPCDLADIAALRRTAAKAGTAHGPVTVLVNNAANDVRHNTEDLTVEEWDANHAVNLRPYFFSCQSVIPGMREAGGGAIINFTSISYMMGNGGYPAYTAANAAITGLTRSLAREYGPVNIRVNAIAPGWVLTDKQLRLWATKELLAEHLKTQRLKEHLKPRDIAGGCLFLASGASRMVTGQVLVIDGGTVVTG